MSRQDAIRHFIERGLTNEDETLQAQLFENTRLAMVTNYFAGRDLVDPARAYAWCRRMYPVFDDGELEQAFASAFELKKDEIMAVLNYMDEKWLKKEALTFYELEDHFGGKYGLGSSPSGIHIDRLELIHIARYAAISHRFDQAFWSKLCENGRCPSEALGLAKDFDPRDIFV